MIRDAAGGDADAIIDMIATSPHFDDAGLTHVRATFEQHCRDGSDAIWLIADDSAPAGVAYCAPEPLAPDVWNLLMLWTRADSHRAGHGTTLVDGIKAALQARGARLLIVETSSLPDFAAARAFYARRGFVHEATIRDYYEPGEDKVVYTMPLQGDAR